jgi:hypothetical protein
MPKRWGHLTQHNYRRHITRLLDSGRYPAWAQSWLFHVLLAGPVGIAIQPVYRRPEGPI